MHDDYDHLRESADAAAAVEERREDRIIRNGETIINVSAIDRWLLRRTRSNADQAHPLTEDEE